MEILKSGLALGAEVKYLDLKKDLTKENFSVPSVMNIFNVALIHEIIKRFI